MAIRKRLTYEPTPKGDDDWSFEANNAMIALREGGVIRAIYVAQKGHLSHTGGLLLRRYKVEHKVRKLIDLGDIQVLEHGLGPDIARTDMANQPPSTIVFHRDLGYEKKISIFSSAPELCRVSKDRDIRYVYLFSEQGWTYCDNAKAVRGFMPLTQTLVRL